MNYFNRLNQFIKTGNKNSEVRTVTMVMPIRLSEDSANAEFQLSKTEPNESLPVIKKKEEVKIETTKGIL